MKRLILTVLIISIIGIGVWLLYTNVLARDETPDATFVYLPSQTDTIIDRENVAFEAADILRTSPSI